MRELSRDGKVRLTVAKAEDFPSLVRGVQEAFAPAVHEAFGPRDYGAIPSDEEVWSSFQTPGAAVYHIFYEESRRAVWSYG